MILQSWAQTFFRTISNENYMFKVSYIVRQPKINSFSDRQSLSSIGSRRLQSTGCYHLQPDFTYSPTGRFIPSPWSHIDSSKMSIIDTIHYGFSKSVTHSTSSWLTLTIYNHSNILLFQQKLSLEFINYLQIFIIYVFLWCFHVFMIP